MILLELYLLVQKHIRRSDRNAFMSTFCNTLPVGCLKFCFSLEISSSILPFTISFQDDRTESSTISHLAHCNAMFSLGMLKSNCHTLSIFQCLTLSIHGAQLLSATKRYTLGPNINKSDLYNSGVVLHCLDLSLEKISVFQTLLKLSGNCGIPTNSTIGTTV